MRKLRSAASGRSIRRAVGPSPVEKTLGQDRCRDSSEIGQRNGPGHGSKNEGKRRQHERGQQVLVDAPVALVLRVERARHLDAVEDLEPFGHDRVERGHERGRLRLVHVHAQGHDLAGRVHALVGARRTVPRHLIVKIAQIQKRLALQRDILWVQCVLCVVVKMLINGKGEPRGGIRGGAPWTSLITRLKVDVPESTSRF